MQAKRLHVLSASITAWQASKYGQLVKFCDTVTLAMVHNMFEMYSVERNDSKDVMLSIQPSRAWKEAEDSMVLTGLRSTSPAGLEGGYHLDALHKNYWKNGSIELDSRLLSQEKRFNPMFLSGDASVVVHYGTDPLLGFHLVTAYAPLMRNSSQTPAQSQLHAIVTAARSEFREWCTSFRSVSENVALRVVAGDALAVAHTLRKPHQSDGQTSAPWYRDQHCFDPLIMEDDDHDPPPRSFDIINTSNLMDHIGALTLLSAVSPLLSTDPSAGISTELLVRSETSGKAMTQGLLCGDMTTIASLIGLVPVGSGANISSTAPNLDELMNITNQLQGLKRKEDTSSGQQFIQMTWKRPCGQHISLKPIHFNETGLARVLFRVYRQMFESEDVSRMFQNLGLVKLHRLSFARYHRGSFALFLRLIRDRVVVDWNKTIGNLLSLIENDFSLLMGRNYIQELYVSLHLLGVYSIEFLRRPVSDKEQAIGWKDMPSVVFVTLLVPRDKLAVFTDDEAKSTGTPPLNCIVQSASMMWLNVFAAIQVGFGSLSTSGTRNSNTFQAHVCRDTSAWKGSSPLIVSFAAPSWMLLLEPRNASVALGIQSTPSSTSAFMGRLGIELKVYETRLGDATHVYMSHRPPNQSGFAVVDGLVKDNVDLPSSVGLDTETCIHAEIHPQRAQITKVTGRISIRSESLKSCLNSGCHVHTTCSTPWNLMVQIGTDTVPRLDLPIPIDVLSYKTRVARKSSYVEVVASVEPSESWKASPSSTYPLYAFDKGAPVLWDMPHLNLEALPIVDTTQHAKLEWLNTHLSLMFTAHERRLRSNPSLRQLQGERTRVEFKESLFSIFMHFTGLQGRREHVFGINTPDNGGVHLVLFVSKLRLDLSNRTVVLDAAVLPLHDGLIPKVAPFLQLLTRRGLCNIRVDDEEMRLWKHMLPAWVERCRAWEHRNDCEYIAKGCVPLDLCQCARGHKFPARFEGNVPGWEIVAEHAVRVAISPLFAYSLVHDDPLIEVRENTGGCNVCGSAGLTGQDGLLWCARCRKARYCSRECQRKDWKKHKASCTENQDATQP